MFEMRNRRLLFKDHYSKRYNTAQKQAGKMINSYSELDRLLAETDGSIQLLITNDYIHGTHNHLSRELETISGYGRNTISSYENIGIDCRLVFTEECIKHIKRLIKANVYNSPEYENFMVYHIGKGDTLITSLENDEPDLLCNDGNKCNSCGCDEDIQELEELEKLLGEDYE